MLILLSDTSEGVTMRVPLYVPRVSKSLSSATSKSAFVRITAYLYCASNLHTDTRRQNRLQRRRCPVLFPGELFRQDAHDLRVNLITSSNHLFAHRFFERQSRRAATFSQTEAQKSRRCVYDDNHPLD